MNYLKDYPKFTLQNKSYYFSKAISWPLITTRGLSVRYIPSGYIFGNNGPALFAKNGEFNSVIELLGFLNSKVAYYYETIINPTMSCSAGVMKKIPLVGFSRWHNSDLIQENISLSMADWDSLETSWSFKAHPLAFMRMFGAYSHENNPPVMQISSAYKGWVLLCDGRFNTLKQNEEALNRNFIDIYGLQDQLTPEIEDKDVTVRKANLGRDIRSFISYAVGCMFGRYSIYKEGLIYAGGEWDFNQFENFAWEAEGKPDAIQFHSGTHFFPDQDNIIPITDDEYFHDDIANRFMEFVSVVYGSDTLEENLRFIADALGGKGSPRDVIRNYFLNDFYADHLKVYQKRPIYWLFDSGKKNGFKCLIYMHRYQPDTIARIRTDYVHELQGRYRTAIADLERRMASASTAERVRLSKQLTKLQDQAEELRAYEEKIHHLADQMISIDLDDGVKVNYAKFQDVLAKIK